MRFNLPAIEYVRHPLTGYTKEQKFLVANRLNVRGNIKWSAARDISKIFMYSSLSDNSTTFLHGKKRITYHSVSHNAVFIEEDVFLKRMMQVPKLVALVALVKQIAAKGEKILIFDTAQHELLLLTLLFSRNGIKVALFSSIYDPPRRANIIQDFKKKDVTVLLGSIGMLSEGHNVTEGNHILFVSYPSKYEKFYQALGRLHRYPQKKTVYVHILAASLFDELISLTCVADAIDDIKKHNISDLLKEFEII
jgi:superfamily II DNA or RNA helicase